MEQIVLFGAGHAGRYVLQYMKRRGEKIACLADNDESLWGEVIDGIRVVSPKEAHGLYGDAMWVASAMSRPAAPEIRAQMKEMGVKSKPLWECLEAQHGLPPDGVTIELRRLVNDPLSTRMINDQIKFRQNPNYESQESPDPAHDIYFPDFIQRRQDEHFVDCGAYSGDTIKTFQERWGYWSFITAFEPDRANYAKLRDAIADKQWVDLGWVAVSDSYGMMPFQASGDYSSHLAPHVSQPATTMIQCRKLDDSLRYPPTYIKMDIEGSELEALWGARRILKEHKPVLAICAYHTSDHLWQIPLLIHAIQPDYRLYFRRYGEGAFELVWYAVPADRVRW